MTYGTDRSPFSWPPPSHPYLCRIFKFSVICVRPIGPTHHLMKGNGELTHVAVLSQPERSGGVDQASRDEGRESMAIEIRAPFVGLGFSAHGAQKLFGWFGGSINGTGGYGKGSNEFGLF
jgi:hypothetical protein